MLILSVLYDFFSSFNYVTMLFFVMFGFTLVFKVVRSL